MPATGEDSKSCGPNCRRKAPFSFADWGSQPTRPPTDSDLLGKRAELQKPERLDGCNMNPRAICRRNFGLLSFADMWISSMHAGFLRSEFSVNVRCRATLRSINFTSLSKTSTRLSRDSEFGGDAWRRPDACGDVINVHGHSLVLR